MLPPLVRAMPLLLHLPALGVSPPERLSPLVGEILHLPRALAGERQCLSRVGKAIACLPVRKYQYILGINMSTQFIIILMDILV